ncbi:MAG: DUF502 domain-containing protein [Pirellulaceae bacterium]|nr:DUF502 domain-containing protein [Pirellulaceae bacterium]
MTKSAEHDSPVKGRTHTTLRHAMWRGIGIIAPPLVTLLLLIWLLNAVEQYVLQPLESGIRQVLVAVTADVIEKPPPGSKLVDDSHPEKGFSFEGFDYVLAPIGRSYLPEYIVKRVNVNLDRLPKDMQRPLSANDYCASYVKLEYMPRWFTIPSLLLVLICGLYFVGRFFAAGIGRFFFNAFEGMIHQVPLISNVYSSVKQVTDFVFSEREIQFTKAIAVEYPKAGAWTLGFVTGESIPQLRRALDCEVVSVFVPTSPMPMTGFTVNVPKSDIVELDMTVDQAIQFIVSCGVVCPVDELKVAPNSSRPLLRSSDVTKSLPSTND